MAGARHRSAGPTSGKEDAAGKADRGRIRSMSRPRIACGVLLATSTAIALQCGSFSGSDATGGATTEAGADGSIPGDAASLDVGGGGADALVPDAAPAGCSMIRDAALCVDFDEEFPPSGFSNDTNADPQYLALTDGGHSPPRAFLATVKSKSAYAKLYQDNVIAIPNGKKLHFRAQVRAPQSAYSDTEVELFLLQVPGAAAVFYLVLDSTGPGAYTANFNYGYAATSDGGPLCAEPAASVPTSPGEWFTVDVVHEPVFNLFTVRINGTVACGSAPLPSYLPPAGNGPQPPFRANLGIGYADKAPQSVAIDDVVVTFE